MGEEIQVTMYGKGGVSDTTDTFLMPSGTLSGSGIQRFQERLSDKVHATTPKGIVGGFEFTVFQRNLKE